MRVGFKIFFFFTGKSWNQSLSHECLPGFVFYVQALRTKLGLLTAKLMVPLSEKVA